MGKPRMLGMPSRPVREKPPCYGCSRDGKKPGCHDRCAEYGAWKREKDEINRRRAEEKAKPFSKLL